MPLITLTTDFGLNDWFVGAMKGVILNIQPEARIVDIAHGAPSGDIWAGALALMASCRFFPKKTIHVAVIDPGVGSARAAIAVETDDYIFVGPDNGLLSLALSDENVRRIHRVENYNLFLHPVSHTFHGRDIFAPVAAHLSKGCGLEQLGPRMDQYEQLELRAPMIEEGRILGEVIYVDRFGNAFTNITVGHLGDIPPQEMRILVPGRLPFGIGRFYHEAAPNQPIGIIGSTDFIEISINGGNAATALQLRVGSAVQILAANGVEGDA